MTPRRTRQALCMFFLMAAAVAYNALFLQTRSAPGSNIASKAPAQRPSAPVPRPPKASTALAERSSGPAKEPEKRTLRVARVKPDSATADVPDVMPRPQIQETASVDTIRAVQRELRQRGYGALASDGTMRPATRAAIMAYEHDNGMALTGQASDALLSRILFGGASAPDPAAGKVRTADAEQMVRSVQKSLAALGYQPGPADGQIGEDTVRAIREYEMDKGLVPKGRISAELVARLAEPVTQKTAAKP